MQVCHVEDVVFVLQNIRTGELITKDNGIVLHHHDYLTMSRFRLLYEVLKCTPMDIKPIRKALIHATN
jgi:hypothetical protein